MQPSIRNVWYRLSSWRFSQHQQLLHSARQRILGSAIISCIAFLAIIARLVDVMVIRIPDCNTGCNQRECQLRQNVVDRNGVILATQLITASVYANPKVIIDAKEAATKLCKLFPHWNYDALLKKLQSNQGFVWIERHASPKIQEAVHSLGIPGIYLQQDQKRAYPHGSLACHVIGRCDIDGRGVSGVERAFDTTLRTQEGELKLSLDIRVQHAIHNELVAAVKKFKANAANAMVMDVETGEVIAMVSLPDYDLNRPMKNLKSEFNRNTLGVYEQGSTFKILNVAIALESGVATLNSIFDNRNPVQIGRFKITDFRVPCRELTLVEALLYSSNIAAIKIAQRFGPQVQKHFMEKFGILNSPTLEISELGNPLLPRDWRETAMMSVSFGYGIAVTPLHTLAAIAGIVNNGYRPIPTLKFVTSANRQHRINSFLKDPCVSAQTSKIIRHIMRMIVSEGTARKANIEGYQVFAKTGTAYQSGKKGGYGAESDRSRTTSFIGGFPTNRPQYVMIVMLDDPKAVEGTYGFATAGWNVAPVAGQIIERIAPLLGVKTSLKEEQSLNMDGLMLTSLNNAGDGDH
ncbi:MAG: peptidoglycan D,D-transpeptidase FtsI family protein [Pseudomonadota bacterium]|nr:penicillin-binding protein 2 [Alphaproteobacteria bacterium]